MTYQEYLKKMNELAAQKWAQYDMASKKAAEGDKVGQAAAYAKVDAIQEEMGTLINPESDELLTDDEGLLIFREDVGSYEDVERKHSWMRKTY